jgi:Zn-finger nucleic acid-binding protein
MLISCPDCRRQYDVGGMRAGEQVRCRCGKLVAVPEERVRDARVLHCSSCGGVLRVQAARCDYCGSQIVAADRQIGAACPECFARLPRGARFCSDCGVEIRPEAFQAVRAGASCPRCQGSLVVRDLPQAQYTECTGCGGIWLDEQEFQEVIEKRDLSALGGLIASGRPAAPSEGGEDEVRYLPCPTCGQLMNRKNFAGCSGVIIDACKGHGLWFDCQELEKVIAFVKAGGLDKARQNEISAQKAALEKVLAAQRAAASAHAAGGRPSLVGQADWTISVGGLLRSLADLIR